MKLCYNEEWASPLFNLFPKVLLQSSFEHWTSFRSGYILRPHPVANRETFKYTKVYLGILCR